eukprot:6208952-Pleurochrysis_carterae.AAC.4
MSSEENVRISSHTRKKRKDHTQHEKPTDCRFREEERLRAGPQHWQHDLTAWRLRLASIDIANTAPTALAMQEFTHSARLAFTPSPSSTITSARTPLSRAISPSSHAQRTCAEDAPPFLARRLRAEVIGRRRAAVRITRAAHARARAIGLHRSIRLCPVLAAHAEALAADHSTVGRCRIRLILLQGMKMMMIVLARPLVAPPAAAAAAAAVASAAVTAPTPRVRLRRGGQPCKREKRGGGLLINGLAHPSALAVRAPRPRRKTEACSLAAWREGEAERVHAAHAMLKAFAAVLGVRRALARMRRGLLAVGVCIVRRTLVSGKCHVASHLRLHRRCSFVVGDRDLARSMRVLVRRPKACIRASAA